MYSSYPGNFTSIKPMNIRVLFVASGQLWRFDAPTLILSILSAILLFSVANRIVSSLANYCICDPTLRANLRSHLFKEIHLSHNRTGVSFTDDSSIAEMANAGIRGRATSDNLASAAMI